MNEISCWTAEIRGAAMGNRKVVSLGGTRPCETTTVVACNVPGNMAQGLITKKISSSGAAIKD